MLKRVGYSIYAHRSNISELMSNLELEEQEIVKDVLQKQKKIPYEIIKFNRHTKSVSLIECDTWNTLNEPIVGNSYCFNIGQSVPKIIKGGTKVYHNKWQFVSKSYTGFDIEQAKERTKIWNSIPEIKANKSRIGNIDYWYAILKKYSLSI